MNDKPEYPITSAPIKLIKHQTVPSIAAVVFEDYVNIRDKNEQLQGCVTLPTAHMTDRIASRNFLAAIHKAMEGK